MTTPAEEPIYGYEVTYKTHDGQTLTCHYAGNARRVKRQTLMRARAKEIVAMMPFTRKRYVAAFGDRRLK